MHGTQLTDPRVVSLAATRIRVFLLERWLERKDEWFTVEQIANALELRPYPSVLFLALKALRESGNVEWDTERLRHTAPF